MTKALALAALLGVAAAAAGCASSGGKVAQAAREACVAQHVPEGDEMARCVARMEEDIEAARAYRPPPPPRPSRPQH